MAELERDPQRIAATMLGLSGARVVAVNEDSAGLMIVVELEAESATCPACGQPGVVTGTQKEQRQGLPVFGRPAVLSWQLRRWHCTKPSCEAGEWVEEVPGER
jgi:transposase